MSRVCPGRARGRAPTLSRQWRRRACLLLSSEGRRDVRGRASLRLSYVRNPVVRWALVSGSGRTFSEGRLLVMDARVWRKRAVLVGTAVGAVAASAAPAQAGVIGVGNAAFGNSCSTKGSAQAAGGTAVGPGVLGANLAQLPLHLSRNHCGSSGIICDG
ncbi:chaplin family protein [Streptomyces sp. PA5.6]|uniref:chaplin family protein n=1 Tax=Streptomyces sp. PA5.6 TaxID=3035651 RepID=UPI003904A261